MNRLIHFRGLLLALLACVACGPAVAGDRFEYSVTYRGVLSMGTDMAIADVTLSIGRADPDMPLEETRLEASSEEYPAVEALYPFRYRFRSWSQPDFGPGVVAFDAYRKTGREKHAAFLVTDAGSTSTRRLAPGEPRDRALLAQLEAGESPSEAHPQQTFDRLGLLRYVRRLPFAEDQDYSFDVTNGKKRYRYVVKVEAQQSLVLDGVSVPAWKVRFDGERIKGDSSRKPAHRPLYVWFSKDNQRVPLRVEARHAVGLFRVELSNTDGLVRLATAER